MIDTRPKTSKHTQNRIKKNAAALAILFLFCSGTAFSQDLSADEIIQKVNDLFNPDTSYAKTKMTIVTTSGEQRTFVYEAWSKGQGDKGLIRYLEPRRVKDNATLMLNHSDDIWMYFPRTQRVRKMASHFKKQKMQGSDFSYEDMGGGDTFITDYDAQRLDDEKKEGQDCYTLELTRKEESDSSYSRLLIWVVKENFVPVVIAYYDENDPTRELKSLVQSDIQVIDGIPTAMKMVMHNDRDNTKTEMEFLEVQYNIELDDSMFTERGLKK